MDRKTKFNVWYIVIALMGFMLIQSFYQASRQYTTIPYSRFEQLLDQDKIDQVWIEQNTIQGTLKKPEKDGLKQFVTTRVAPDLATELDKHHITYTGEIPSTWLTDLLSWVLPAVIFFGLWMFVITDRQPSMAAFPTYCHSGSKNGTCRGSVRRRAFT